MTTQTLPVFHYGGPPLKQEDENTRTTSPTVTLQHSHQDYTESPVTTSHSTLSTSSPLPSDSQYGHHSIHQPHMDPPLPGCSMTSLTTSPIGSSPIVLPVRSASWAPNNVYPVPGVPTIITTQGNSDDSTQGAAPQHPSPKLQPKSSKTVVVKKRQATKKGDKAGSGKNGETVNARRQKRLERNRESARLSRRRRKQYLEVLEDRVNQLSLEMDQGRRAHAAAAIETLLTKRREILKKAATVDPQSVLPILDRPLGRTSQELSVLATFQMQQLRSFVLPAHSKFVLWLTLQGDVYFRGGRAASERLSAARIGERMLQSGNDRVTPLNSMWPLFCNEVGLSYDQEERVRNFQRTLLQELPSWVERHTARASTLVMQSFHDSVNSVAGGMQKRNERMASALSPAQRLKFLAWSEANGEKLRQKFQAKRERLGKEKGSEKFKTSSSHHVAANLYILNDRLQKIISQFPKNVELVPPVHLKRLARRPSFESLGQQKDDGSPMTRENSFASSGSLKRSVSSLSMISENCEEKPPQQVSPEDGETAAESLVEEKLGFVKELIPPIIQPVLPPAPAPVAIPAAPQPYHHHHYAPPPQQSSAPPPYVIQAPAYHPQEIPAPAPVTAHPVATYATNPPQIPHSGSFHAPAAAPTPMDIQPYQQYYAAPVPASSAPVPLPIYSQSPVVYSTPSAPPQYATSVPPPSASHVRKSSFLPPHLNVVPEEAFPSGDGAEDFLMSLIDDGDWAIGEGVDMDTTV